MATDRLDLWHGVGDRDGQANDAQQRDVRKVITNEGDFLGLDAAIFQDACETGELVSIGILRHVFDAKLFRAETHAFRNATGDDGDRDSHEAKHVDAESVLDLVAFELEALAIHIAEIDAAVGHDAVHIERDELDGSREGRVDHRDTLSEMSTARAIRSSRRLSGIMFGPSLGALSGLGCVSMNNPFAPAAVAASASDGMNSRAPPLAPPAPSPGR